MATMLGNMRGLVNMPGMVTPSQERITKVPVIVMSTVCLRRLSSLGPTRRFIVDVLLRFSAEMFDGVVGT